MKYHGEVFSDFNDDTFFHARAIMMISSFCAMTIIPCRQYLSGPRNLAHLYSSRVVLRRYSQTFQEEKNAAFVTRFHAHDDRAKYHSPAQPVRYLLVFIWTTVNSTFLPTRELSVLIFFGSDLMLAVSAINTLSLYWLLPEWTRFKNKRRGERESVRNLYSACAHQSSNFEIEGYDGWASKEANYCYLPFSPRIFRHTLHASYIP